MRRIWREAGLLRRKRRKHQTKQNLRAVKQQWRMFEQTCIDTKDLKDIPELWPEIQRWQLPLVQYTAREVVSGWQFVAYAQERTLAYSKLFAQIIITHLLSCGVKFKDSRFQIDYGPEMISVTLADWAEEHNVLLDFIAQCLRLTKGQLRRIMHRLATAYISFSLCSNSDRVHNIASGRNHNL